MRLSQKKETFSDYLDGFSKSILRVEYFFKKDDSHSPDLSEITDSEKHG